MFSHDSIKNETSLIRQTLRWQNRDENKFKFHSNICPSVFSNRTEDLLRSHLHRTVVHIHIACPEAALAPLLRWESWTGNAVQDPRNGSPRQRSSLSTKAIHSYLHSMHVPCRKYWCILASRIESRKDFILSGNHSENEPCADNI